MRKILYAVLGTAVVTAAVLYYLHVERLRAHDRAAAAMIAEYTRYAYRTERLFIESLPIYEDYSTPAREAELRRYLLQDHLAAAAKYGIVPPVESEDAIEGLAEAGRLVSVPNTAETSFFYYNVKSEHRYLTPGAKLGLEKIGERFNAILRERVERKVKADRSAELPLVKFAVSSALRPVSYQAGLRGRNANASYLSSHSAGVSFDLFYDEYYVSLDDPNIDALPAEIGFDPASQAELHKSSADKLRRRLGYLQGAALRRQFRAILTETLLQLQNEGWIYAILERNQRCYHVTVLR